MRYEDFHIRLESRGGDTFKVSVESPAGNDSSTITLTRSVDEILSMLQTLGQTVRGGEPQDGGTEAGAQTRKVDFDEEIVTQPAELGKMLYSDLFTGAAQSKFEQSLGHVKGLQIGLRIKLHIDPTDPDVARLASLPWELLCHPNMGDQPLALSTSTPVVRYLNSPRPLNLRDFHPPLRILVVVSDPEGVAQLDLEEERKSIEATWGGHDQVEVRFLEEATVQELSNELARHDYHILHYMGHGDFDPKQGVGVLLMETADGATDAVDGRTLGVLLQDAQSLRLVFVNACNTAQSSQHEGADPYAGIAASLVMAGVPAVVAMQFPISDKAAIAFAGCLYPRLAQGFPVDFAVGEARKAIRLADRQSLEWGTPVLFMRTPNGRLFDFAGGNAEARFTGTFAVPPGLEADGAEAGQPGSTGSSATTDDSVSAAEQRKAGPSKAINRYGLAGIGLSVVIVAAIVALGVLNLDSGDSRLAPPSADEFRQFVVAANSGMVSAGDLEDISSYPLRTTLEMKALWLEGNRAELDALFTELSASASAGDPVAVVVLYLASQIDGLAAYFVERGVTTESLLPGLSRAGEAGYGLATFWEADRVKELLIRQYGPGEGIDPGAEEFLRYCQLLDRADAQGMGEIVDDLDEVTDINSQCP